MPSIFDSFQPLDQATKQILVNYNKSGGVNEMAWALATKAEYKDLMPPALKATLSDSAAALNWLCSLIPAPANRAGDWKLFFVRNFMQRWVKDKYPGDPGMSDLAAKMGTQLNVAKGLKPEMDYYQEVRSIAVQPGAAQEGEFNTHVAKNWVGIKQIGWRGDDRDPDTMMKDGFSPRVSATAPIWRPQEAFKDVDLDTTVCVARDIRGSAFFPLSKPVTYSWAYCVLIKVGWNTYYLQKRLAEERGQAPNDPAYKKTVWMFHEKCVSRIAPQDIVFAVQLPRRIFDGVDPLSGVQFRLNSAAARTNFRALTSLEAEQRKKMEETYSEFSRGWYPAAPNQWLTYDGVVSK